MYKRYTLRLDVCEDNYQGLRLLPKSLAATYAGDAFYKNECVRKAARRAHLHRLLDEMLDMEEKNEI